MTEPKDSQTSLSRERESKDFVNALKQYLYGFDLNPVDERRIGSLFLKYADRIAKIKVKKVYVTRFEQIPVYIDLRTNAEISRPSVSQRRIIEFVRKETGIMDFDTNTTRKRSYVEPRQFCVFLLKNFTTMTLLEIGACFRSKSTKRKVQDHTTMIHNIRQGEYLIKNIPPYAALYEKFKSDFNVYSDLDTAGHPPGTITDAGLLGTAV